MSGKVAVCISGQVRDEGIWIKEWINKIPNADIYCAVFDGPLTPKFIKNVSPKKFNILGQRPGEYWREEFWGRFSILCNSDLTAKRKILNTEDKKRGGCLRDNPLRMFYAIEQCKNLIPDRMIYDYVVRVRPDQRVNRPKYLFDFSGIGEKQIMVPRNGWADYLDYYRSDKFFVGQAHFMYQICGLYSQIHKIAAACSPQLDYDWMAPELTLHWAIKHFYGGETVKNTEWDIDRWRVNYKEFANG